MLTAQGRQPVVSACPFLGVSMSACLWELAEGEEGVKAPIPAVCFRYG